MSLLLTVLLLGFVDPHLHRLLTLLLLCRFLKKMEDGVQVSVGQEGLQVQVRL